MKRAAIFACVTASAALAAASTVEAQPFSYSDPGVLQSGTAGRVDNTVYVPGARFPIEAAPSFANSQVYGRGGSEGPGGGQCDAENYSYPWWDNYCEPRSWDMPLCPSGTGHQGQDIRPSTCQNKVHRTVAAENGTITAIGSYSVTLMGDSGTIHRYLHMDPATLAVSQGQRVTRGAHMGFVSNAFGGTPTTIHLHYDLQQAVSGLGTVFVPTYLTLVRSYEDLIGQPAEPCQLLGPNGGTVDNQSRCFAPFGPSQYWRHVTDAGNDGDLYWTNAFSGANPSNWARWSFELQEAGTYRLAVFIVRAYAQSEQTRYRVRHAGREDDLTINLATAPEGWFELGEFDFNAGADQWLAVYDNTGEASSLQRHIIADAVRLERDRPIEEPDTGPDVTQDASEDTTEDAPDQPDAEPDVPDNTNNNPNNNANNNANNNNNNTNPNNNANNSTNPNNSGVGNNSGRDENNTPGNNASGNSDIKDENNGGGGAGNQPVSVASKGVCAVTAPGPAASPTLTGALAALFIGAALWLRRR